MDYFKKKENVEKYKEMLVGYEGNRLISKLETYLEAGSTVLELGMGIGLDLDLLSKRYKVVGSDNSKVFIDEYKKKNKPFPVMLLDAENITCNQTFDCIYSNKVLQHLTLEGFKKSLKSQKEHLKDGGILFATLWYGEYREEVFFEGELRFTYYTEKDIREIVGEEFLIEKLERYEELEAGDSLLMVLRKINKR